MKKFQGIIACFLLTCCLNAQLTVQNTGIYYFYQFKPPHFNNTDLFPLIISLHGGGEAGDGTLSTIGRVLESGIPKLADKGATLEFTWAGKREGFVMLAPQALVAEASYWPSHYVDDMITYGINNLRVDPNRIFLVGYSFGANGTWNYATSSTASAAKLAGIVPAAPTFANGDFCNIAVSKTAVWAFHGTGDNEFITQSAVNAINACSGLLVPAVDSVYPDGGHDIYNPRVYDTTNKTHYPNVYQWMLKVNRNLDPATNQPPMAQIAGPAVIDAEAPLKMRDLPLLDGTPSSDIDDIIMDYLWEQSAGPVTLLPNSSANQWPTVAIPVSQPGVPLGTYTFRLRVKDYLTSKPGHTQFATKTINVTLPASGFAKPATDAGGSIIIQNNESDKKNFGNAYGYACTDCNVTRYDWVQLSGPSTAVLRDFNNMNVNYTDGNYVWFTNLVNPGVYTFQFSATSAHGDVGTDILTITKLSGALPVSYAWFNGKNNGNSNSISWATTSEINSARFDIQRSTDGVSFSVVGSVSSKGGAVQTEYSFEDNAAPLGTTYYRLSQVDKDGHSTLSKTISINNKKAGIYIEKYPNPVHNSLTVTVQGITNGSLQVSVADMQGKTVLLQQWQKDQSLLKKVLNVGFLQNGVYQMIVTMGQEKQISSFVKY